MLSPHPSSLFFFFNDTATTEIYTLSLHDALPICVGERFLVRDEDDPLHDALEPLQLLDHYFLALAIEELQRLQRSEEHTSELQSPDHLVCRLLLEKKNKHEPYSRLIKNCLVDM